MSNRVADQHASRGFYFDGLKHPIKVANCAKVEQLDAPFGLDLKTSSTYFRDWTLNLPIALTCRDAHCMMSDVAKASLATFLW